MANANGAQPHDGPKLDLDGLEESERALGTCENMGEIITLVRGHERVEILAADAPLHS